MDMDLYAQLHGIKSDVRKTVVEPPTKTDPRNENEGNVLDDYIKLLLEDEEENFQEGLESFEQRAQKLKDRVMEAIEDFSTKYEHGFEVICESLEAKGKEKPQIPQEYLEAFNNLDTFMEFFEEGTSIYEMLGFSDETLSEFYNALNSLYEKNEYTKVRDGFFFLITICPERADFWTGLGIASNKLHEYEKAIEAFLEALDLDPTSQEAYIGCLHAYTRLNKLQDAYNLCDTGIEYAIQRGDELWAKELESFLIEAKNVVATHCA
jgi:tetratricopeptide (TPR) repeat protein